MECISIRRPWGSGEGTMISPLRVNARAPEDFPGVIQLLTQSTQWILSEVKLRQMKFENREILLHALCHSRTSPSELPESEQNVIE